jgi:hypothetical protein
VCSLSNKNEKFLSLNSKQLTKTQKHLTTTQKCIVCNHSNKTRVNAKCIKIEGSLAVGLQKADFLTLFLCDVTSNFYMIVGYIHSLYTLMA